MLSNLEQFLKVFLEEYSLLAVFLTMTLESACIPIPSEVVVPYAGILAARGKLTLFTITLTAAFANLTGSWIAYFVGRAGGRSLIEKYGKYIFLSKKHLAQATHWFNTKGEITVFVSRMLPGVRTFISLPAGIAKMNIFKFSIYSFLGALPWNLALAYLGYVFANRWNELQAYLHEANILIFSGLLLAAASYLIWAKVFKKH